MAISKIFFYLCISFVSGILIASIFYLPYSLTLWGVFLFALPSICFLFAKKNAAAIFCLCLVFFSAGALRYIAVDYGTKNSLIKEYNDKEVVLMGRIIAEPEIRENSVQLTIEAQKVLYDNKLSEISGKFVVKTDKYPSYSYADIIALSGMLKTPEKFSGFDYKNYLEKKGITSLMDFPKVEIVKQAGYSNFIQFVYGQVLNFKNVIRDKIGQRFNPPEAKLLSGIVLGDQSSFSQEFKDKLNITGLRHITAVSGMNVAIICSVLMSLFLGLGMWRGQAFYLTIIFVFLFVAMIGFQASVVRAGFMGAMMLLAQRSGRLSTSSRAIGITAAAMLLLNPMLLRWDIGFQLSFLAIMGIVLFSKPLERSLKFIPQEKMVNLRSIIAATLSAQIFTLPILIYNFGRISLVSLATNILIVPVVDWIMIFGFIFALLSSISWIFGWIFIWPCWFLLTYALKVIDLFSYPQMAITIENVSWIWLVISYLVLSAAIIFVKKKERLKFLEY